MAKTFGDLPEEMLIEVLEYLDGISVKQAALVCKEWNRLISITPPIMKKFVLNVASYDVCAKKSLSGKSKDLMSLERKFTRARIWTNECSGDRLMEVSERYGKGLKDLQFSYNQVGGIIAWDPRKTLKILQNSPQLEKLSIQFWDKELRPDFDVGYVTLKKLKKMEEGGNCDIYPLIKAPQLVELKSLRQEKGSYYEQRYFKNFGNFLQASTKLSTLVTRLDVFEQLEPGFPFKLKKLVGSRNFALTENIEKFLLTQAATVETLEAESVDSKFHELVLTNFKQLKTLKANLDKLVASQNFYDNLKPMQRLTELSSLPGFSCETATRAVLGNCPALVKLECKEDRDLPNHLVFVAEHNKSLEVLGVYTIGETETKFSCLKVLILAKVENTSNLIAFLKSNPTVETLDIQWLYDLKAPDVCTLITKTTLKHMKMHGHQQEVQTVCNEVKSTLGSWAEPKLSTSNTSDSLEVNINREAETQAQGKKRKTSC